MRQAQCITLMSSRAICGVMSTHLVRHSRASAFLPSRSSWAAFLRYISRRLHTIIQRDLHTNAQPSLNKLIVVFVPKLHNEIHCIMGEKYHIISLNMDYHLLKYGCLFQEYL